MCQCRPTRVARACCVEPRSQERARQPGGSDKGHGQPKRPPVVHREQTGWFRRKFLPRLWEAVVSQRAWLLQLLIGLLLYVASYRAGLSAQLAEGELELAGLRAQLEEEKAGRAEAWRIASMLERAAKRANVHHRS